jgi:hypothetical protein
VDIFAVSYAFYSYEKSDLGVIKKAKRTEKVQSVSKKREKIDYLL